MKADTLVQLLLAMAGSGVLVAIVQGLFTRGRTRAEVDTQGATATKTITDAAALIVGQIQADNTGLREQIAELRRQIAELRAWKEAAEANMEVHEEWDEKIAAAIHQCTGDHQWTDLDAGPPPPLRPQLV